MIRKIELLNLAEELVNVSRTRKTIDCHALNRTKPQSQEANLFGKIRRQPNLKDEQVF